jgi:hypothetical protein
LKATVPGRRHVNRNVRRVREQERHRECRPQGPAIQPGRRVGRLVSLPTCADGPRSGRLGALRSARWGRGPLRHTHGSAGA